MKIHTSPADARPFRSRAELEHKNSLDEHYRRLGIPSVVAAASQCNKPKPRTYKLPTDDSSDD